MNASTRRLPAKPLHWPTVLFLLGIPAFLVVAIPIYLYFEGFNPWIWALTFVFAIITEIGITGGYHRLLAHRSYEANPIVKWALMFWATSAWQGSALRWCRGHRLHHKHIDDAEQDPYAITNGFWYAHMGWMIVKDEGPVPKNCVDLEKDRWIVFQDRYYIPLAILIGFILPTLLGAALGDIWGGLLIMGALRVSVTQQFTYFVNSAAHMFGNRPYSVDISAKDSFWVALLTQGEGWHNFHHKFEADYRNGVRWWQWDPTKWMIFSLSMVGLTRRLRRMPKEEILKARLHVESLRLKSRGYQQERLDQMRERILNAAVRMRQLQAEYRQFKATKSHELEVKLNQLRTEIDLAKLEFRYSLAQWRAVLRSPVPVSV